MAYCKGCDLEIAPGQLRRGDNWHAECFSDIEGRFTRPSRRPRRRAVKGLTPTQVIVLEAAAKSSTQSVGFARGDRKGTRVAAHDDIGRPWIIAYGYPATFLMTRGFLAKGNEPHVYSITPAGLDAIKVGRP